MRARVSAWTPQPGSHAPGSVLLDNRPSLLRRLALHRLPVHARSLAHPQFHRQLHLARSLRVLQRFRRETRTETPAEVLAQQ